MDNNLSVFGESQARQVVEIFIDENFRRRKLSIGQSLNLMMRTIIKGFEVEQKTSFLVASIDFSYHDPHERRVNNKRIHYVVVPSLKENVDFRVVELLGQSRFDEVQAIIIDRLMDGARNEFNMISSVNSKIAFLGSHGTFSPYNDMKNNEILLRVRGAWTKTSDILKEPDVNTLVKKFRHLTIRPVEP
jgi:hypothetical protein